MQHPLLAAALQKRGRVWGAMNRAVLRQVAAERRSLGAARRAVEARMWRWTSARKRMAVAGGWLTQMTRSVA